jgi:HNH endonuclease/Homing endonuclease associated repeat
MRFELDAFNRSATDEELLQDLRVANAKLMVLGKILTFRSYRLFGKYSASTIAVRFGTWNDGLRRAGLAPCEEKNVSIEAHMDNLKVVWIAKGKQPVYRDMSVSPSRYTGAIYNERFGGWRKALKEFVASVDQEQNEQVTYEVEVKSHGVTKRTRRDPSLALRFFVMRRDRFCCVACGRSPSAVPSLILEVDHVFPWSMGGETIEENLQTLCFDCNRGKGVSEA